MQYMGIMVYLPELSHLSFAVLLENDNQFLGVHLKKEMRVSFRNQRLCYWIECTCVKEVSWCLQKLDLPNQPNVIWTAESFHLNYIEMIIFLLFWIIRFFTEWTFDAAALDASSFFGVDIGTNTELRTKYKGNRHFEYYGWFPNKSFITTKLNYFDCYYYPQIHAIWVWNIC